ncbi:hypothetical protein HK101_010072 [Irineochytrium annulatum]|nr:hypothetical protein HK101_010072 [Irineochytrium annulatum]
MSSRSTISRVVPFVLNVATGVVVGVYLAQTYAEKIPNVEQTARDLYSKAQVLIASATKPAEKKETKAEVVEEVVVVEQPKANTN